jgi:hypothetical protein
MPIHVVILRFGSYLLVKMISDFLDENNAFVFNAEVTRMEMGNTGGGGGQWNIRKKKRWNVWVP